MGQLLTSLAVLACPIGMGLMMWMMMRGQRKDTGGQEQQAQVAQLRAEVEQLKAQRARQTAGGDR